MYITKTLQTPKFYELILTQSFCPNSVTIFNGIPRKSQLERRPTDCVLLINSTPGTAYLYETSCNECMCIYCIKCRKACGDVPQNTCSRACKEQSYKTRFPFSLVANKIQTQICLPKNAHEVLTLTPQGRLQGNDKLVCLFLPVRRRGPLIQSN